MYDPLVVDTFLRVYSQLAPDIPDAESTGHFSAIARGTHTSQENEPGTGSRLSDITASTEEMLVLYELAQGLTAQLEMSDAADLIAKHLRRVVPATTTVFYLYDSGTDELVVAHASGENTSHFADLRIPRGQRLTGWVAANRRPILNSDPVLDLGDIARTLRPPLRSCLSTPLLLGDQLIGVLTVYSTHRDGFTEDHRRVLEVIARQVSHTFRRALYFRDNRLQTHRDRITGLPNSRQLEDLVAAELADVSDVSLSILLVRVSFTGTNSRRQRADAESHVRFVAEIVRTALRGADLLFQNDLMDFVIVLLRTDAVAASGVARRVAALLTSKRSEQTASTDVHVAIGGATAPSDGATLTKLIAAAEKRQRSAGDLSHPPSIH
jgi:diguanylate cyclase (GGDEF)-like protein